MEILVENDGYTHHHDKHIHKVGTFVHTGEECAQIGSVAKEEVGKPFTKEEELNQKLERLSELNALLNMDEREDTEAEQSESKEKEERPARGSIHEKLQIYKEKSQRESENGREDRKRDFGLE